MTYVCNGICYMYIEKHNRKNHSPYSGGVKYCSGRCGIYLKWNGIRCPCCNCILRTRPRGKKIKVMETYARIC